MEEERAKKEPNRPKMAQDGAKMIQHGAKMEPRWPRVAQDEAKMAQYGGDMIQDGGGSRIAIIKLASNRMAIAKVGSRIPQLPAKHRQEANETHTLKSLRPRRWPRPAPQHGVASCASSMSVFALSFGGPSKKTIYKNSRSTAFCGPIIYNI